MDSRLLSGFFQANGGERRVSAQAWREWTAEICLVLGCALLLSGIICFFAYNWADMTKWSKFSLVLGCLAVCLAGVWRSGLDSLVGRCLILSSSILVGVFLAVYGQVYQTGANAWQLFILWAGMILPWTLVSRSAAQWLLWLVLLNVAAWFRFSHAYEVFPVFIGLSLLVLNGTALAGREILLCRGQSWLKPAWAGLLPLLAMLTGASALVCRALLRFATYEEFILLSPITSLGGLLGGACIVAAYVLYWKKKDVSGLSAVFLCGFPIVNCACIMILERGHALDLTVTAFLVFTLVNVPYAMVAATVLLKVQRLARGKAADPDDEPDQIPPPQKSDDTTRTGPPRRRSPLPLAVAAVHMAGGILGAVCLAGLLGLLFSDVNAVMGITMILCATGLYQAVRHSEKLGNLALSFCMALVIAGVGFYMLYHLGFYSGWEEFWKMYGGLAVILGLVYLFFPQPLMRFLAVGWLVVVLGHHLLKQAAWGLRSQAERLDTVYSGWSMAVFHDPHLSMGAALVVLCGIPLILMALRLDRLKPMLRPAAWAALCCFVGFMTWASLTPAFLPFSLERWAVPIHAGAWVGNWTVILTVALLFCREWTALRRGGDRNDWRPLGIALLFVLSLAGFVALGAGSVLLGLTLLALGYGRADRIATLLGSVLLPWFLFAYYYSLQQTLLRKSFMLVGSGLILLGVCLCLGRLGRREAICASA